jgi:hypothetical protein
MSQPGHLANFKTLGPPDASHGAPGIRYSSSKRAARLKWAATREMLRTIVKTLVGIELVQRKDVAAEVKDAVRQRGGARAITGISFRKWSSKLGTAHGERKRNDGKQGPLEQRTCLYTVSADSLSARPQSGAANLGRGQMGQWGWVQSLGFWATPLVPAERATGDRGWPTALSPQLWKCPCQATY